jgi:hypothetical protein
MPLFFIIHPFLEGYETFEIIEDNGYIYKVVLNAIDNIQSYFVDAYTEETISVFLNGSKMNLIHNGPYNNLYGDNTDQKWILGLNTIEIKSTVPLATLRLFVQLLP